MPQIPRRNYEQELKQAGFRLIAGIDEVGRGAWAGPVVACAVILPPTPRISGVRDSKQLSPKQRECLAAKLQHCAIAYSIGVASHKEIDAIGITQANALAMIRAVHHLQPAPDALLIDAFKLPQLYIKQQSIIHGDALEYTIAAASILAKVARDQIMIEYHAQYPQYGFHVHKGYGTAYHRTCLEQYGISSIHRRSFQPMSFMV